jgi:hypothetical protein
MSGFSDLLDLQKLRAMFEELFGERWGPWFYGASVRILLPLAVLAAILFLVSQILGGWKAIYSDLSGLFSQASVSQPPMQALPPPRRLSSHDKRVIIERLSQLKGTKIAAGAPFGDDEAKAYRDDLVDALTSAGWAFDGHVGEAEMQPPAYEVGVRVNQAEVEAGRIPAAAVALVAILVDLHIMDRDSEGRLPFNIDPGVAPDRFWLFVGIRRSAGK